MQLSLSKIQKIRKRLLICFSGVDGSGKSRHAKSLLHYLSNQGYSCSYAWGGIKFLSSYFFYGLTWLLGYWTKLKIEDRYSIDPLGLAPKNLRKKFLVLFRFFIFLDIQINISVKVRMPLIFGKVVICDRYIYDVITSSMVADLFTKSFSNILFQTTPAPQLSFLTDTSTEVLYARRCIPMNILDKKRKAYLDLEYSNDFFILDTSTDFERNQQKVRRLSLLCLKREQELCHEGKMR